MDETTFTIGSSDGEQVFVYRWAGDGDPKAIVQLAHGMGEHAARYRRLAEALVDAGYVVYANDHRGHGRTAGSADRHGDLGSAGWSGLIDDMRRVDGSGTRPSTPASRSSCSVTAWGRSPCSSTCSTAAPTSTPPCCRARRRST